tara:strand:- start:1166 stop:2446 length:1281 start_codon:yes stop_codon:yes gene_type:complete
MKNDWLKIFLVSIFGYALIAFSANAQSIVIKNATIYDGINNSPFVGNILIDQNKIKKISTSNMQADLVIDASDKIVTPGFIATDTQIGIVEIGALSVTRDDSSNMYKIGFSIFNGFNPNSTLIPWNRSNGITSALTLPDNTSSPIGGLGSFFVLDGSLDITAIPDMVMLGEFGGSSNKSRAEQFSIIEDLLILASSITKSDINSDLVLSELIGEWSIADAMSLHPRDLRALYKLANENLPLIIRSNRASDLLKLIELKEKFDLNIIIMGAKEAGLVATKLAEHNIPLIIDPMNNIPESFDELASNIRMAGRLEKTGVEIMFTVSRSHNHHLIRQGAGVAVANGLSYGAAIKSLTSTPAEVFGIKDRGVIESGKIADLIIWEADPLEPSSMPEYIFINGKNMDLTNRSSRLRDRYTKKLDKPVIYRD